ncbi:Sfum_1244 family protein, partial [Thermodesulfobacteriota bacterium]
MDAQELKSLTRQVLQNCDISDAYHAGLYSICGLALRLRDLYKWEKQLSPWEERDSSEILDWIDAKETRWEAFAENDYGQLCLFGENFDPFDSDGINTVLEPHHIYYGAGYAHSLKPTFFLAVIENKTRSNGYNIYTLGRELARDLLTIPAMSQNDSVLLRQESANLFLWDKIFYIKKSGRYALYFALEHLGISAKDPSALRQHLPEIFAAVKDTYIYH